MWIIELPPRLKFSHDQAESASYSYRCVLGHCGVSFFRCPLQIEVHILASIFHSLYEIKNESLCSLKTTVYVGNTVLPEKGQSSSLCRPWRKRPSVCPSAVDHFCLCLHACVSKLLLLVYRGDKDTHPHAHRDVKTHTHTHKVNV